MPKGVRDWRIGDSEDAESIHFVPAKSEASIQQVLWSHGPGGLAESVVVDRESGIREGSDSRSHKCRFHDGEIPYRSRKAWVNIHRVSGICET